MPKAKAVYFFYIDADEREHRYQIGLETQVGCVVNDVRWLNNGAVSGLY